MLNYRLPLARCNSNPCLGIGPTVSPLPVAIVIRPLPTIINADFIDDLDTFQRRLDHLLSELLVIERIDAAAQDDRACLPVHVERPDVKDFAPAENRSGQ